MIDRLVDAGAPVQVCCRLLGVSRQGCYRYRKRPTSVTELRRRWMTGLIREIHVASRGTNGYRRIHAELTICMGISCSSRPISVLMTQAGIAGLPGSARIKRLKGVATADDLVNRKFHRLAVNELWVTDIAEHPTREGKIYCATVLDACSRKIIGWAIDSKQDSVLVVNALDLAIRARRPGPGGIVNAAHGVQFTSWVFTQKNSLCWPIALVRHRRRRTQQCDVGVVLVHDADRVAQPEEVEYPNGAGERDFRVHRSVLQPSTSALLPPVRDTARLRPRPHPAVARHGRKLKTESGNRAIGQVNSSVRPRGSRRGS